MVARMISAEAPAKLTQENHPENAVAEEITEKPTTVSLASTVTIGALCSLVGMTLGSAALCTSFQTGTRLEVACLIPLVGTLVCIVGGWMGAFFHMIRSESKHPQ
jgi:hypothetical protein